MNIGIPNEISVEERRVALTPVGVYALCQEGHEVLVEKGTGESCGFSDQDFRNVGAQIVFSPEEVYRRSDLVLKVQAPTLEECDWFDSGKTLFSTLGLGQTREEVLRRLQERKVTAVGYELAQLPDGTFPILTALSELAGMLLPQIASRLLQSNLGGRGITLGGVPGIPPANVVILGAGAVGLNAARAFSAAGAQVMVMDKNVSKLRSLDHTFSKQVSTSIVTPLLVDRAVRFADVLVGAVLIRGRRTPHLVSEAQVKSMKSKAVVLDVSIDQGGCVETSRPTTLSAPTFVKHGVIHYCVPNITACVARTASHAINNSVLPWVLQVSRLGIDEALARYTCLQKGTYLRNGESTFEMENL